MTIIEVNVAHHSGIVGFDTRVNLVKSADFNHLEDQVATALQNHVKPELLKVLKLMALLDDFDILDVV